MRGGANISRREAIWTLAGAGVSAAAIAGFAPSALFGPGIQADAAINAAVRYLLAHEADAKIIGRAYLALRPREASPALLRDLLSFGDSPEALAGQVFQDFRSGFVVSIEGWTVSETEARACALLALS